MWLCVSSYNGNNSDNLGGLRHMNFMYMSTSATKSIMHHAFLPTATGYALEDTIFSMPRTNSVDMEDGKRQTYPNTY